MNEENNNDYCYYCFSFLVYSPEDLSEIFMQKSDSMWRLQFSMKKLQSLKKKTAKNITQPWPSHLVLSPTQLQWNSVYFLVS